MGSSSKDLLHLENKYFPATSTLESTLLVCKNGSLPKKLPGDGKPITTSVSRSQVLGKVKDFLGVISEANKRLQQDAKDNSQNHDIEVLTGNESEVIEMDLMLGVADLHTPEAVAAAESAIAGGQPLIDLATSSSDTDSEDTSNDDEDEDDDVEGDDYFEDNLPAKVIDSVGNNRSKRPRPGIVELP